MAVLKSADPAGVALAVQTLSDAERVRALSFGERKTLSQARTLACEITGFADTATDVALVEALLRRGP